MKKIILFIFLIPCFLGFVAHNVYAAEWTILVYLAADNDLEAAGIDDFLEMASVGSDTNIKIVVQFDRASGYDTTNGDWTSCKRFYITSGMTPTAANASQDLGEVNMADPATLTSFINWGTSNYPATRYALVLWNHGGGWRDSYARGSFLIELESLNKDKDKNKFSESKISIKKQELLSALEETDPMFLKGVCWDDTSPGDYLEMREVRQALDNATTNMNLVGFDACLMGMIEVAHEIKDTGASVMVGSEHTEPGDGWPYNTFLSDLAGNPTASPSQLGTYIVDRYYASYGNSQTQSAIDLTNINTLSGTVSTFANSIRNNWNSNKSAVKSAAQNVIDEIDDTIIREHHGSSWPGANGLAIYLPTGSPSTSYNGTIIKFAQDTLWDEFLGDYYSSMSGSWIESARSNSQDFSDPDHIDLYDFCNEIVNFVNYTVTPVTYAFEDISSTGGALGLGDDAFGYYSIPFTFTFYGIDYTAISVASNGTIYFTNNYIGPNNVCIPGSSGYDTDTFIAPFWDDLNPTSAGEVYAMWSGSAPNRRVIIQWEDVPHYSLGSSYIITFQAILYEGSNQILFQYQDAFFGSPPYDWGASASVGVQLDSTTGTSYSCNSAALSNGLAILFTLPRRGKAPISAILNLLLLN
ncbi:MAG: hypothetical protein JRJ27_17615 [Deltaproteobacteria bacterium]|nr:hypothetical protein [Deltaproteobacteria bacterium]